MTGDQITTVIILLGAFALNERLKNKDTVSGRLTRYLCVKKGKWTVEIVSFSILKRIYMQMVGPACRMSERF